ncbi:DUF4287 domain-containing protein [uncultured Aquimarina sp.]|uniref:DUF4287 domain-containing protein n=1 Tax=uncultured Aquimarina sp. TaxID=575652 RepID=UPI00261A6B46|nr:DUF4287 domain-containing protein [uncultured Aquimarina sp.]
MDQALQTMINNMPEKTGKSLEEWKQILKDKSFAKHGEAVKFLKEEHSVTHGFANTIVSLSKESNDTPDDLVTSQYKGKENLFPIYEKLLTIVGSFGDDVVKTPKKPVLALLEKSSLHLLNQLLKPELI